MKLLINGAVFHGHENDYSSSIEERVEILFSNPYRFYISEFVWIMRGSSRTDELYVLYNEAYNQKKFKLCRRIEEAIEVLNMTYGIEPVRVNMKKPPLGFRITCKLDKYFYFYFNRKIMKNLINKKITVITLEVIYASVIVSIFSFYAKKKLEYEYEYVFDSFVFVFTLLILLILIAEWIRRISLKESRPKFEKYIYLPLMFLMLILGIWFINLFLFEN